MRSRDARRIGGPARIERLVFVSPAGGINIQSRAGEDWRPGWRQRRPDCPPWFADDQSDYSDRLVQLTAPTLVMSADRDTISPVAVGETLARRLPRASHVLIADATHSLTDEQPEAVADAIHAHLDASA